MVLSRQYTSVSIDIPKQPANIVKSLNQLEDMVKKEQLEANTVRGGGEIGFYESPRRDFDYGDGIENDESL